MRGCLQSALGAQSEKQDKCATSKYLRANNLKTQLDSANYNLTPNISEHFCSEETERAIDINYVNPDLEP